MNEIPKDIQSFTKQATPSEIGVLAAQMSPSQIQEMIHWLDEKSGTQWKEKLEALIFSVDSKEVIETLSKNLSLKQVSYLIDHTFQTITPHQWKFSAIVMGMPLDTFAKLLTETSDHRQSLFQHESVTEPIQHQVTQICHDFNRQLKQIEKDFDAFSLEIKLDLQQLDRDQALKLYHTITLFAESFEQLLDMSNKALALAWKSNRSELVEALNYIKDSCQKYISYGVGIPRSAEKAPTGLYAELDKALFQRFGDSLDPNDREALEDHDPALEGLTKFSLWDLKDYLEIGLISTKKSQEMLCSIDQTKDADKRERLQENLFTEIKTNLEKRGLKTVRDLKLHVIFSKKSLEQFIKAES